MDIKKQNKENSSAVSRFTRYIAMAAVLVSVLTISFSVNAIPHKPNQNNAITYLITDHLGTPRIGMDVSQQVIWKWTGDTFGSSFAQEDVDNNGQATQVNLRFPGQYYDSETGFHYNWNRYYDPKQGRYITSDPIGLAGGLNTYGYVSANPLREADPLGLCGPLTPICAWLLANAPTINSAAILTGEIAAGVGVASLARSKLANAVSQSFRGGMCSADDVAGGLGKYSIGSYDDLKGTISGLDAHHVGQKAIMKQLVEGYDINTAPAILVPKIGHTIKKGDLGVVSRSTKDLHAPRQVIARDIKELRRVYPDIPNSQLKQLIDMNKNMYPNAMSK